MQCCCNVKIVSGIHPYCPCNKSYKKGGIGGTGDFPLRLIFGRYPSGGGGVTRNHDKKARFLLLMQGMNRMRTVQYMPLAKHFCLAHLFYMLPTPVDNQPQNKCFVTLFY